MHWVYLSIDVLLLSDVYLSLGLKKEAKLTSVFNQNCQSIALLILALLSSV